MRPDDAQFFLDFLDKGGVQAVLIVVVGVLLFTLKRYMDRNETLQELRITDQKLFAEQAKNDLRDALEVSAALKQTLSKNSETVQTASRAVEGLSQELQLLRARLETRG